MGFLSPGRPQSRGGVRAQKLFFPRQSWMPSPALGGDPGRMNSNLFTHGKGERRSHSALSGQWRAGGGGVLGSRHQGRLWPGQARSSARGSEMRQGAAGAVGRGQQRLPIQGRAPLEKLREWALGPGSKLGQNWDFLWNFPLPLLCPPSFIFNPLQGPSHP